MSIYRGTTPPISPTPLPGYTGPPVLPPITGTPRPPSPPRPIPLPPWAEPSITTTDLPPTEAQVMAALGEEDSRTYPAGPFCFGLDKVICEQLPRTIHLGGAPSSMMERIVGGVDIPLWGFCGVLLNTLCGVVMAIIILTLLGIAFSGLVQE